VATKLGQREIGSGSQKRECSCKKRALVIEGDELWLFVGNKQNQQWVWLAKDRTSEDIVGCYLGAHAERGAVGLWQSLPDCYLDVDTYTDFWQAYARAKALEFQGNMGSLSSCKQGSANVA
jgi:hypothetical protein